MGRIAEESIQQVIAAANIVEVVGGYFPLKRAGAVYKACCPFHNERTPSFQVSPTRNTYHCFGCGKGGNAIGFVMAYESLPFADAVRKLASKFSVTLIEEATTPEARESAGRRARQLTLHQEIARWFHTLLLRSPMAEEARAYLKGRGLTSAVARNWLIGYAPSDASYYRTFAREKGLEEDLLVEGGLLALRDPDRPGQGSYAKFGHRVMFPIRNDHGDVIAFSGRLLEANAKKAKYVNSPASELFNKSAVFFGLDKSKRAIHKAQTAVICEGQIDMISCFEHGIENIVAPLGTAFTEQHARLLKRHADQVVLCFDSDNAGQKAAQKCFSLLAREGIFVKVAGLPPGDDPDSLLRRDGADAMRALLDGAVDYFDFLVDGKSREMAPGNLRDRMRVLREISESLSYLTDATLLDGSLLRVSTRLGVDSEELRRMTTGHTASRKAQEARQAAIGPRPAFPDDSPAEAETEEEPEEILEVRDNSIRMLLQLSLTDAAARKWMLGNPDLCPAASPESPPGTELLQRALAASVDPDKPETVSAWMTSLPPGAQAILTAILHTPLPSPGGEDPFHSVSHICLKMRAAALERKFNLLNNLMRLTPPPESELMERIREVTAVQKEFLDLKRRLLDIPQNS